MNRNQTAPASHSPQLIELGEQSQLLVFEADIRPDINRCVLQLMAFLRAKLDAGVRLSPAYHSLLIEWPELPDSEALHHYLAEFSQRPESPTQASTRCWTIPVCYGGDHGIDLNDLAQARNLSPQQLIQIHSDAAYRVFMLGFAPGYAYLGPLDPRLHSPRRSQPRARTPAGSISIGGRQTLIAGVSMPSGWHLIGQTPIHSFRAELEAPSLFRAGDVIRFQAIDENAFEPWQRLSAEQQWQRLRQQGSNADSSAAEAEQT